MLAVFIGMVSNDTLCPEHRAWVEVLGSFGLVTIVGAVIGLLRRWPLSALLALISAVIGIAIGIIDAIHAPARGNIIAASFAVLVVAAILLIVADARLLRWDRRVLAPLGHATAEPATAVQPPTTAENAPAATHDDASDAVQRPAESDVAGSRHGDTGH